MQLHHKARAATGEFFFLTNARSPPFARTQIGKKAHEAYPLGMTQADTTQLGPFCTAWDLSTGNSAGAADLAQDKESSQSWPCSYIYAEAVVGRDPESFWPLYGPKPCGKIFKRFDSLQRHLKTHNRWQRNGKFPCPQCLHYQGHNAFDRKDHLNQHLRKIHRYTRIQCPVAGCDKVGSRGWNRETERKVHQQEMHGDLRNAELATMNAEMDAKVAETMPGNKKK